jgi:pyrroloquinoline quinone biosynthesis protein B
VPTPRRFAALALTALALLTALLAALLTAPTGHAGAPVPAPQDAAPPAPYVVVLGVAQDAGHPQAACRKECCLAAWDDPDLRHQVASLGIVHPATGQRWLVDATPDAPEQMHALAKMAPTKYTDTPDGVFITHAHMGHYTGLMHLGREAMGAHSVPVFTMPRMRSFLEGNQPWSQLVQLKNIDLRGLDTDTPLELAPGLHVEALRVPHRDELSETIGLIIRGPQKAALWLPDIDKWERWSRPIEDVIAQVDVAFLDGTFYADGEVGRPMAEIPHPFISESAERFASLPDSERSKIRFVHFNHTNPALRDDSDAAREVHEMGLGLARRGEQIPL